MAIGTFILILDAQSSPSTIDLFEIENADDEDYILDLEMDTQNNRMLVTTDQGFIHSIDLLDTSWNPDLPAEPSGGEWSNTHITSSGDLFAFSNSGVFTLNTAGTGWTLEQASSTSNWPSGTPGKHSSTRNNLRFTTRRRSRKMGSCINVSTFSMVYSK